MLTADTGCRAVFKQVADAAKKSPDDGLRLLANGIRDGRLEDAEAFERAGRLITKLRGGPDRQGTGVRALLLGQCTTSWVATMLPAVAWGYGCILTVREGEYDNVIQELMSFSHDNRPHVVITLPWTRRLFADAGARPIEQRVAEELSFWKQAWTLISERTGARILQVGYDWMLPGALGHHLTGTHGEVSLVRQVNEAMRAALPRGSFFLDLEQVSGMMGREQFYDPRRYFWTKQPFSEAGALRLTRQMWAGIRALMTGPKKVLVVDLDNTLWGGVVGETGPLGIALGETPDGEAFGAFQSHIKALGKRGVVLAVCSKNNREDALAPFEQNPEMALALSDFAHIEASWEPKSAGLRRIADALSLGLDSFVFFDDNPAEREEIRQAVPEVEVVDVPADPAEFVRALQAGLWFEATELSQEDSQRAVHYQQENQRRVMQNSFTSTEDYLKSLQMSGSVQPIDETNIQRAVQLIAKTNQFNLTTRRHSLEEVRQMLSEPDSIGLVLHLADKFGDYGLISVLLAVPLAGQTGKTLRIDTWLMSCRVIGRTAEQFVFNSLMERARELGYERLSGEFIPTQKNALVADLFERLNFVRLKDDGQGCVTYHLSLQKTDPAQTYIQASRSVYV